MAGEPTQDQALFLDETWPLVLVHLPRNTNANAIESVIAGFERVYQRRSRFSLVIDCTSVVKFPGAAERKALTDWMRRSERLELERMYTIATAIVLSSGPMRALLAAVQWISPPATPQALKASQAEAVEWCSERLEEAGFPITPAISSLKAEHQRRDRESRRAAGKG
jgi:hypothetical protein